MINHQNQRLHLVTDIVAIVATFLMRENFTPLNFSFDHSTLIVSIISIYFANRCFTKGKLTVALSLVVVCAIWIYAWMFADRSTRWDNCMFVTFAIFAVCLVVLLNSSQSAILQGNFLGAATLLIFSIICIMVSIDSFIQSDINEKPGSITIYSRGRYSDEVVGEEWVSVDRYNRELLGGGFATLLFGAASGWIGIRAMIEVTKEKESS